MNPVALFLLCTALVLQIDLSREADKYCRKDSCPDAERNIGCGCGSQTKTSYGSQCAGKRPRKVTIDSRLKSLILREHNTRRNSIACGLVIPHQPAAGMPEVLWDNELQHLAWCNARRCVYGHDRCRSTSKFEWPGQNIASKTICGKAAPLKPEEVITASINVWFLEHQNTTPAMIDSFPGKVDGFWSNWAFHCYGERPGRTNWLQSRCVQRSACWIHLAMPNPLPSV
ncbi:antigen 5 like allergen Cul n 1-like isoform X2 [Wyeomyia smithii]|uniref:antigen 5 like allergen Cul n 1-like isoform X2 n=1 Tax=Wyeomyia smithii TaxID=174621 RepID=UPI002467DAE0|nr:antigen 5 like allergen Cul n 1-like isoform X2 [Wyeomyia smithii]